ASFMLTLSIRRPAICACPTPTCQAVILVSNRNVYVLIFTSGARFSHRRREVRVSLTPRCEVGASSCRNTQSILWSSVKEPLDTLLAGVASSQYWVWRRTGRRAYWLT